MKIKCKEGHIFSRAYEYFRLNSDCPVCKGVGKIPYGHIKELFKQQGYKLLTTEENYKDVSHKVKFECPNGHVYKMRASSFKEGYRCNLCKFESRKKDFYGLKSKFESEGYKILSKEYKDSRTKLKCRCPEGHTLHVLPYNFTSGKSRCPTCSGNKKYTIEEVREIFKSEGYILLSKEYINSHTPLKCICPEGHEWNIRLCGFVNNGSRCYTCHQIKLIENCTYMEARGYYCGAWTDKEYKESIRIRDNHKCLNPCCKKKSKRLHLHHIDYDKNNCTPQNLVTLCNSCHSQSNHNREWHKVWYQALLRKRYNYKY